MGDEAPPLLVIYPNGDLKQAIRGRGNLGYRRCVTPFLIAAVCRTELLTPLARPRPAWQARATKTAARQGRKGATAHDRGLSALPSSAFTDVVRQSRIGPLP